MNVWVLIIACACILAGFFWYNSTLSRTIDDLDATYESSKVRLSAVQTHALLEAIAAENSLDYNYAIQCYNIKNIEKSIDIVNDMW